MNDFLLQGDEEVEIREIFLIVFGVWETGLHFVKDILVVVDVLSDISLGGDLLQGLVRGWA